MKNVNTEWDNVFYCSDQNYEHWCEKNRETYNNVKEENYQTIDACVDYAISKGNHAAFVHFYIEKAKKNTKIFSELLQNGIDIYDRNRKLLQKKKIQNPSWSDMKIVSSACWRDYRVEYLQENYKTCTKGALSGWRNGEHIPDRDEIVQCALCFGMDTKQTNEMLSAAGHERLYFLDVVDIVAIIFLDYYHDLEDISIDSKIKRVKECINKCLKRLLEDQPYLKEVESGKSKWISLVSLKKIGPNIADEITFYREVLETSGENKRDKLTNTEYLTMLFKEKLESYHREDPEAFIDALMESGCIDKKDSVFAQKYYGCIKKTVDFIKSDQDYIKNLKYSEWSLVAAKPPETVNDFRAEKGDWLDDECERLANNLYRKEDGNRTFHKFTRLIHLANNLYRKEDGNLFKKQEEIICYIWGLKNVVDKRSEDGIKKGGEYHKAIMMVDGRYIKGEEAYVVEAVSKQDRIRYAIATGQEDHIGQYLKYAGYWDGDLYTEKDLGTKTCDRYDRTDFLIVYALKYRDCLIEEWVNQLKLDRKMDKDTITAYRNTVKKEFPFIKLLMLISRDIQFVATEIKNKPKSVDKYGRETVKDLLDSMVYPILKSGYVEKKWSKDMENVWWDYKTKGKHDSKSK